MSDEVMNATEIVNKLLDEGFARRFLDRFRKKVAGPEPEVNAERYLDELNPEWVLISRHVGQQPPFDLLYFAGGNFSPKLERAQRFDSIDQAQEFLDQLGRGVWAGHLGGVEIMATDRLEKL
jgi:hypothetical protein